MCIQTVKTNFPLGTIKYESESESESRCNMLLIFGWFVICW